MIERRIVLKNINELKKDIQSKCPQFTDDVLELLTEYFIAQISNKLKEDAKRIGLLSVVSDGKNYSCMSQTEDGIEFILD